MSNNWLVEDAAAQFVRHQQSIAVASGSNEANTRLRAIDTILFGVLRWDKLEVDAEQHIREAGFADYVFSSAGRRLLVLEAKREGVTFVLKPSNGFPGPIPLSLITSESPAAAKALRQACSYATELGIPFSAISNGAQWIITSSFVAGERLEDRLGFVFAGLSDISHNFRCFWECFSPIAIKNNLPLRSLSITRKTPAPSKLSTQIPGYLGTADPTRNSDARSNAIELLWYAVTDDDENDDFLDRCYIETESSTDQISVIRELLAQRRNVDDKYTVQDATSVKSVLKNVALPEKPVLILGRIGHGKTTFMRRLRKVAATSELSGYLQLDIDFLDRPDKADEVANFVYDTIEAQLAERFQIDISENRFSRSVLRNDLLRFRKSAAGVLASRSELSLEAAEASEIERWQQDRFTYLKKVMDHLRKSMHRSIAIFFDNLDKRMKEGVQEAAFLRASAIARDWAAVVFVPLRPDTYFRSVRLGGVLDSISPKVFTLSSPDHRLLLKKRFQYASAIATGASPIPSKYSSLGRDHAKELPDASLMYQHLANVIWEEKPISEMFGRISNGNVRQMLKHVLAVITSKRVKYDAAIQPDSELDALDVRLARTILLLGSHRYFQGDALFINLFDTTTSSKTEHFIRFVLLKYLCQFDTNAENQGFVSLNSIVNHLSGNGFLLQDAQDATKLMYERECIEAPTYGLPWDEAGGDFRVTPLGRYHIDHLVKTFEYYDAVVVDTPIISEDMRKKIKDVAGPIDRLSRAREFLRYLDNCASMLVGEAARASWGEVFAAAVNDITLLEAANQSAAS